MTRIQKIFKTYFNKIVDKNRLQVVPPKHGMGICFKSYFHYKQSTEYDRKSLLLNGMIILNIIQLKDQFYQRDNFEDI